MLAKTIIEKWETTASGYSTEIEELSSIGFPTYVVKIDDSYGVALPLPENMEINERFSSARLYNKSMVLDSGETKNMLILSTRSEKIKDPFSSLCAELVYPGENGEIRHEVIENPLLWWHQWKELLGNKNVNETVYDVLGELFVMNYLASLGSNPVWSGPDSSTYDIDCDSVFYEVKSSILREKKQITLSNQFQLDPPQGKELFIVFCQFESSQTGITINSVVDELSSKGYSKDDLNQKLESLGLERRSSSRKRSYIVHAVTKYKVDDSFPAIRGSSFIGGSLPKGVQSITYTVSLDGIDGERLV